MGSSERRRDLRARREGVEMERASEEPNVCTRGDHVDGGCMLC